MSEGPSRYQHLYRAAGLFAAGLLGFVILRQALVPADFGVEGFYRAGALTDARAIPIKYGGEAACLDCHEGVGDERKGARHEKLRCETCHGPLATHATGDDQTKPRPLNPRLLCLSCHTELRGRPTSVIPQIAPADHGGDGPCVECHKPHRPKIEQP
jgi:hypothetical protein